MSEAVKPPARTGNAAIDAAIDAFREVIVAEMVAGRTDIDTCVIFAVRPNYVYNAAFGYESAPAMTAIVAAAKQFSEGRGRVISSRRFAKARVQ